MSGQFDTIRPLNLDLLGTKISVRCHADECRQGIMAHFHPHCVADLSRTPDFIVECDWPSAGRYLFRARPETEAQVPLQGVWVRGFGDSERKEWQGTYPPLPPFTLPAIRNRFVGLHASCLALDEGPVLILVGPRGSGKTTLVAKLANEVGGELLADEMSCLHTRTRIVTPFAMAMGISSAGTDGALRKEPLQADRVVSRISSSGRCVSAGVFLNPAATAETTLRPVSQTTAFRLLLNQHLDLGTDMGECLTTLADLSTEVPFAELTYGGYAQADAAVLKLAAFARNGRG